MHPELLRIIEAAGRPFYDVSDRHWYFENGVLSNSQDFWNKLTALMDLMNSHQPDRSFQDFLESLPNDDASARAKAVAALYVEGFHAGSVDRIGVHGLIKATEAGNEIDGAHAFRLLGGYDVVTERLRDEAVAQGTTFHLNTTLKELRWSSNQVVAVCIADKRLQVFLGSRAVITLPLGVLQAKHHQRGAVRFVPGLPRETEAAVERLAMGHAVRIILKFRERFWEKLDLPGTEGREKFSQLGFLHFPEAPVPTWWTMLPIRSPVMVGWVGGPDAGRFVGRAREYAVAQALGSLKQIFGVSEDSLGKLLLASYSHDWSADPFSRGAYAYLPVNGLEAQQALAQPVNGTLFFAGEATSVGHIGTVHGAIETGQHAARKILELGSR
jgi:monoamine oxidase